MCGVGKGLRARGGCYQAIKVVRRMCSGAGMVDVIVVGVWEAKLPVEVKPNRA